MTLDIYVPAPGSRLNSTIAPGSGIVGHTARTTVGHTARTTGMVVIDYEGNVYGAVNLTTWEERVRHAAGRHRQRYPTRARAVADHTELVKVGELDGGDEIVVFDQERVDEWGQT